jgi:hypothetical protein
MADLNPRRGHTDVFTYDIIPDAEEKNPVPVPKEARNALHPHIYDSTVNVLTGKRVGYQRINVTASPEYPKIVYRRATEQEIKERRLELTEESWLDLDFDLLKETGLNQRKRHSDYEKWINRPTEVTVRSREEEEATLKVKVI